MTAGAKPFEKTNICCVTFSWSFLDYWSSQALLQIKKTPLLHQIFLSVAVSFHAHLLFLYFWNCNDYAVVGRATFHLAKPHSGCIKTSVSTFISGMISWRNLKRDSPRLSRYLCLMVKEWKTLAKWKINDENGLWFDPEQFLRHFKICLSSGSSPTIFGFYARPVESLLTRIPSNKNFISEATFIFECLLFSISILLSDKVLSLSRWL